MRITRKTLLDIPAPAPTDEPARPDVPDHPAYQQILATVADTGKPLRARDLCQASTCPSSRRTPKASAPS
ncbi:hypothetical protein AB0I98_12520 [Streptomyces sp. NPDC050211]|uniref:hypothetical protein n=1 Tax=Streptomyces sp. NPDC050211 TaxID=3154932 RepID=UPI003431950D